MGKQTTVSGSIKIGQRISDDFIKTDLRKFKIWNSLRSLSEIRDSYYYNNNGIITFNNDIIYNEIDNLYLSTISSLPVNNLIVYILFSNQNSNIYILNYKSDFIDTILHNNNNNLILYIPMKSSLPYIYILKIIIN